uniref:Exocyst subunit Exo70 family protein n=1 Tax=Setaria italica TaxID=4555 RepID=K3XWP9_SETIT
MDAQGSSSRALAGAGAGDGWPQPNWRVAYSYSSGSRGSSSSYSSTPGTTHSTPSPYSNTSGEGFTPSPQSFHGLDLMSYRGGGEGSKKKLEYIKYLLQEFCVAKGDVSILGSWLSEIMSVSRQIVAADASATSLMQFAGSWIRALTGITDSILAPYDCDTTTTSSCEIVVVGDGAPAGKLRPLIGVRGAVSRASQDIRLSFCSTSSEEAKRITDEMASLLLAKEARLDEAIWNTMEEVRTRLLASRDDDYSSWWGTQGIISPDIHKVTRAIVSYINILSTNCATVYMIVDQAVQIRGYVPKIHKCSPWASLIMETVSCLEEKLAEKSRSFPDQSMRFLFLINNSYFIWQQLYPTTASILESHMSDLARKIDNYIQTYLQVSWAPVLSCLSNSTPLCLGRSSSPAKFEAEFQKTYTAQKLWKVPDPKLRRRIRVAVIETVVPSFTKYLEYNDTNPSRITPEDLMDMLQELFEG